MQTRAVLKAVDTSGPEPKATIQLTGLGNLDTFYDGFPVSHGVPTGLLAPGTDVIVEISDRHRPGDGQIVAIASVTGQSHDSSGGVLVEQSGTVAVPTDGAGSGAQPVSFPSAYSTIPNVTVGASSDDLGAGTIKATAITTAGFTIQIHAAGTVSSAIAASWSSSGTM